MRPKNWLAVSSGYERYEDQQSPCRGFDSGHFGVRPAVGAQLNDDFYYDADQLDRTVVEDQIRVVTMSCAFAARCSTRATTSAGKIT
jgi:hypothetical protein